MNYNFTPNHNEISIEVERDNNFYKPAQKTITAYKIRPSQATKSQRRALTQYSLLGALLIVGIGAQSFA